MIKFLTLRQFICPLSLFLKEIPFASLTNAIDMTIERVLTGFLIGWNKWVRPLVVLYSFFFVFFSDAPSLWFCILLTICFFKQIADIFFNKEYYQESYILIIEYSSGVTVVEWLDGSFKSQSRWFDTRKSQDMYLTLLSLKQ